MIKSVEVKNFQSHKNTFITLHPGINAFIGATDNGKTALMRAIYWARYNEPSGDSFVSKWAKDKKGKQIEDCSVSVLKDGNTLTRGKGKELNGYKLSTMENPLEALGKGGLPDQVVNFFNMTDVNIQKQMDKPFLVGSKPSEITQFLNSIVDMTEIDQYLSCVDSKKRANKKDIVRVTKEVEDLQVKLAKYDSLDTVKKLVGKLEKVQNRISLKSKELGTLGSILETIDVYSKKSAVYKDIPKLEKLLKKSSSYNSKVAAKSSLKKEIVPIVKQYREASTTLSNTANIDALAPLLKKSSSINAKLSNKQEQYNAIKDLVQSYNRNQRVVTGTTEKIEKLVAQLPTTCPTCGQPWEVTA